MIFKNLVLGLCAFLLAGTAAQAGVNVSSMSYSRGNDWLGFTAIVRQEVGYGTTAPRYVDDRVQANLRLLTHSINNAVAAHVRGTTPGNIRANVDLFGTTVWQGYHTGSGSVNTPDITASVFGPTGVTGTFALGPFNITAKANLGVRADLNFTHETTGTTAIKISGGPRVWAYGTGSVSVGIWIAGLGLSTSLDFAQISFTGYARGTTSSYSLAASVSFDPYRFKLHFFIEWCGWFECVDLYETDLIDTSGPTYVYPLT